MLYRARTSRDADGTWVASALELPHCWSRGRTLEEALDKLRREVRHRIEFCPCSAVEEADIVLDVVGPAVLRGSGAEPAPAADTAGTVPPPRRWASGRAALPAPLTGAAGCPGPRPEAAGAEAGPGPRQNAGSRPPEPQRRRGWRRWED